MCERLQASHNTSCLQANIFESVSATRLAHRVVSGIFQRVLEVSEVGGDMRYIEVSFRRKHRTFAHLLSLLEVEESCLQNEGEEQRRREREYLYPSPSETGHNQKSQKTMSMEVKCLFGAISSTDVSLWNDIHKYT
jgi:hypothetical protein